MGACLARHSPQLTQLPHTMATGSHAARHILPAIQLAHPPSPIEIQPTPHDRPDGPPVLPRSHRRPRRHLSCRPEPQQKQTNAIAKQAKAGTAHPSTISAGPSCKTISSPPSYGRRHQARAAQRAHPGRGSEGASLRGESGKGDQGDGEFMAFFEPGEIPQGKALMILLT